MTKQKLISKNRLSIFAVAMAFAIVVLPGASMSRSRAESASAGNPVACKSGDCCGFCPRTSPVADREALPKSANGVTLDPKLFVGPVRQAYRIAEQNPMLLAQLDCYCGCYQTDGHKSLLDCYRSRHGATCQICTNEVLEASRLFDSGMAPEQIKQSLRRKYQASN
jgi:hypothetical protein